MGSRAAEADGTAGGEVTILGLKVKMQFNVPTEPDGKAQKRNVVKIAWDAVTLRLKKKQDKPPTS